MGLDTTHNAFHGSYSSFMRFRRELLLLTDNIEVNDLVGYGGDVPVSVIKDQGIRRLMNQSDCDGEISPKDCKLIADDLSRYLDAMDTECELYRRAIQFKDGCISAYTSGETLEFH